MPSLEKKKSKKKKAFFGVRSSFTFENIKYKSREMIAHGPQRLRDLSAAPRETIPTSHAYLGNSHMLQLLPHLCKLIRTTRGSAQPECHKRLAPRFALNVLDTWGKKQPKIGRSRNISIPAQRNR